MPMRGKVGTIDALPGAIISGWNQTSRYRAGHLIGS
jgi:hypothetical protein